MKKNILALIITVIFIFSLALTGCAGKQNKPSSGTAKNKEKTLVYAQGSDPRGLDPAYVDDGESAKVIVNVYEGLLKYKEGSTELEPCLAESWNISKDGKEYTFKLRKGVKFHDGTAFNADAVKFNIERQFLPNVKEDMPYASFTFGSVQKVEKIDDYTVKIILKEPYTPFLANLAMCLAAPMASPQAVKKNNGNLNEAPVGTGPFKFVSWKKGESITLEKNNDYWGEKAKVDKAIFKFTKENSVRASELMTGAVDIMDGVDPNDVQKIKDNKMNILNEKGMNINYMAFNCSRPPFNNVKLRQAISYAINKEELVKYLYQGFADVANTPLPSFIPGFNDRVKSYDYNPEKARQSLKEAGKENLQIKMIAYSNPRPYNPVNGQKLAEAIQNYLAKVGVKATIDVYPWKEYKEKIAQGEGDVLFYGWTGDNGDADNFLSLFDSKEIKSTLNAAKYNNAKVDELLAKGRKTPNGEERNNVYKQIQELVDKDAAWVTISYAKDMVAYSPKVKNFKIHPTGVVFLKGVEKE
ncbi:peptide/nickel transport system substrate-binding protein [Clostridium tetanomorphum]|uniref:ABC transporter substrate-binding protein n=1 Tax=Clostridium tetanomorphum TaxID=1553 RepID=A0A923J2M7_CLOTT|nr:ABC transporter substrate-binding protein [Clostridium tetanomorphum]KAJ49354.1 periplasmic dipeptide transport protein DppA [Clostridium tetanomorphum DSM 665]KAJ53323.1 periplasmic dipeptide transport protein DppA [Clostridium tetanomorphum DSM 665]MBC2400089.1 ABC transporter substrate-binding protein [Clostridium tetanomorphum]MBP1866274.1 peptide/nickel transport system substrate-binding protein [Clostridium tetanomorphum]NRS86044.1 peptide/nickel transport system substrate-binding pro